MEILIYNLFTPYGIIVCLCAGCVALILWWLFSMYYHTSCEEMEFLTPKKKKEYHDEFLRRLGIIINENENNTKMEDLIYFLQLMGKGILVIMMMFIYIFLAFVIAYGMARYSLWIPMGIGLVWFIVYRIRRYFMKKKVVVQS